MPSIYGVDVCSSGVDCGFRAVRHAQGGGEGRGLRCAKVIHAIEDPRGSVARSGDDDAAATGNGQWEAGGGYAPCDFQGKRAGTRDEEAGAVDDPAKIDHPVTMFYLDGDRLLLTHYCDAGNRPRMAARTSPDGKKVEFDFLDLAGSTKYGHMQHAVFTVIDANHHTEDWTFMMPGDKPMHAHMDLQRVK